MYGASPEEMWTIFDMSQCTLLVSRSALCEGPAGCGETAGAHAGPAEEAVCPTASAEAAVLCLSPGPSDGAENPQLLPRRDAHILENERP